ncbi:FkbM family methyltransferase [Hyphomonas hirschiana VP5]|nr:FkbM family methyltransferase [Hyphomonas hirschiana VP5]
MPNYARRLREMRPDEVVFEVAVGNSREPITLFLFEGTGLSTGVAEYARRHEDGGRSVQTVQVPCIPLSDLFDRIDQPTIHWLKVDVEGMEASVLQSWADHPARPWVVVVESTVPNSPEPNYDGWEDELFRREYKFAYFDGLSRFYVHENRCSLLDAFKVPPNVFDNFFLSDTSPFSGLLASKLRQSEQDAASKATALGVLQGELENKASEIGIIRAELNAKAIAQGVLQGEIEQKTSEVVLLLAELADRTAALRAEQALQEQRAVTIIQLEEEQHRLTSHIAWQGAQLDAVWRSTSWKVTAPLRAARRVYRQCTTRPRALIKSALRRGLIAGVGASRRAPFLKKSLSRLIKLVPPLERRLMQIVAVRRAGSQYGPESERATSSQQPIPPWSGSMEDDVAIALEVLELNIRG